jgi:adenylate cyclase class IV
MTNIEFKAHLRNPAAIRKILTEHQISLAKILKQTDTYFRVENGRLKLREIEGDAAQLIFYQRADHAEVKRSDYFIVPIASPTVLRDILAAVLGIRVVVKKTRELSFLPRRIIDRSTNVNPNLSRLHLDTVDGLGQFLEIEVILGINESPQVGDQEVGVWMHKLGIKPEDLIAGSYADMLEMRTD